MDRIRAFLRHFFINVQQQWFQLTSRQRVWGIAIGAGSIFILLALIAYLSSDKFSGTETVDPAYQAYVSSYSSGVLSVESPVRIRLAYPVADSAQVGQLTDGRLFRFHPSVDGESYWVDRSTIEFLPEKPLIAGQRYQVKFDLEEVVEVPDAYESFEFAFQTIQQNYSVELIGLTPETEGEFVQQQLQGTLLTADYAEASAIEGMLTAEQDAQPLPIQWSHSADQRSHSFTVENIVRRNSEAQIAVQSSGTPLGLDKARTYELTVPSLETFELLNYRVVEEPEQYLELRFSDPLQSEQELQGLIQLSQTEEELRYVITKNIIKAYPANRLTGPVTVTVNEGIKNARGEAFPSTVEVDVQFEAVKPAVRLTSTGVIMPTTDGMVLPFEAVNLKAVDVTVVRVFEENILQFFQVNQYDGRQEIRRVGRPVVQQEIPLNGSGVTDLGKWNRFTLDLEKIIEAEPGALYQVNIGFRQKHTLYSCGMGEATSLENNLELTDDWNDPDKMYWESFGDYYYATNYHWEERDNPCSPSYYGARRSIQKNLLVSNLGLIAKKEAGNRYRIGVTDLQTTQPQSGVDLKLYDLQQQLIAEGSTDGNGWWEVETQKNPFLAVAEEGTQRSYLRMDDANALSLSNFDVSGQSIPEGIKGFLYGDRGVWRPGDSLHLNFILQDQTGRLPQHHPVIFELSNPQGQLIQRIVRTDGVGGIYNFSTATDPSVPTGNWTAQVQVGGASFTKTVRIETIKPNRLRADLDFGAQRLTSRDRNVTADLAVAWLNGATARNLRAQYELLLTPRTTTFARYPSYEFDDPALTFEQERREVFDGRVDEEGNASFQVDLSTESPVPGTLNATFIGKVFEEGGNFSTDQLTLPYYPYSSYVGVRVPEGEGWGGALVTGETHTVDLVVVDSNGETVARDDLEVNLYKLEWRWWWDQSDHSLAQYVNDTYREPVQSTTVDAPDGSAAWELSVGDSEWGRYLLRVCDPVSGHCSGQVIYLDSPYAEDQDRTEGATMLTFTSDKDTYQVGEEATLYLPGQSDNRALVSLENGSRIIETHWVTLDGQTANGEAGTAFSFEVTEAMVPNVYANVTLLQPHVQTTNDLPIRMYGVLNMTVENPETHLQPQIELPEKLAPESEVTLRISEANEREMAYTVAIVDEGLLDITNFSTPDPHEYFYSREALGVKTWDVYDYVIGAYGGELERLLAVGGDEALATVGNRQANRFPPMVQFLGPFYLDDDEVNEHTLKLPNYVGSVRVMVVAAYEGAYGSADTTATVSQPLMVLGTLPRVLGPEEEVRLPVTVFAMDNSVKDVRVSINTNDLINNQGSRSQDMFFPTPDDRVVDFTVKTTGQVGVGHVQIDAAAGPNRASYPIELDVRTPNPPVTRAISQLVRPGNSWNTSFEALGMEGTNQATLEVSAIAPLNLSRRLEYLLQYPHGCIEQTVSAAFPQLYLGAVEELTEEEQQRTENNVKVAINRLNTFLTNEGAFAYWPGSQDADEWSTSYAGHFLLEAQRQGYSVPVGLLRAWTSYQQRRATQWGAGSGYDREDLMQAYRLYTLALAGEAAQGAMNRLREKGGLSLAAEWRLAAAYALMEQPQVAEQLISGLGDDVPAYQETYGTYGSAYRDEAMILETLTLLEKTEEGLRLYERISSALSDESVWMSTQTTAFCLIAATQYAQTVATEEEIRFSYQVAGSVPQGEVRSEMSVVQRPLSVEAGRSYTAQLTNLSEGDLYARIVLRGTPGIREEEAQENGVRLQVNYKGMNGEPVTPDNLLQGTDFLAEVTVSNPGTQGDLQQLALTHIMPSGWEIINTRLQESAQFYQQDAYDYQDIRDDRVYTYFDLAANQRKTFTVVLNATYAGRFYQPGIYCEAMYDHTINGSTEGEWVEVEQP